jgi:hypothetical protein
MRSLFAITLGMAGALVLSIGAEIHAWFRARDAGHDPLFPFGSRLFRYGRPPERYRSVAWRLMIAGFLMFSAAFPAVVLARVG